MNRKLLDKVDTGLEYAVVAVPAALPLVRAHDRLLARLRSGGDRDAGASVVEWVLITAVLVTLAVGFGVLITNKLKAKTDTINFDAPAG